METLYCCFTCPRDYDLIPAHQKHIEMTDPDGYVVYVIDKDDPEPEGCYFVRSAFDRRGNLNGREAVMGEVLTMIQLCNTLCVQRCVKIDTDTALLGIDWLPVDGFAGFHSCNGYYCTGCCYGLTMTCLLAMWDYVMGHNIGDNRYTLPEDQVMTMIAAISGQETRIIENDTAPHCVPYVGDQVLGIIDKVQVVHCGQWQRTNSVPESERHGLIKRDIETLLERREMPKG